MSRTTNILKFDPAERLEKFKTIVKRDQDHISANDPHLGWRLLTDAAATGRLDHMHFHEFLGADHLHKMFKWIDRFDYGVVPQRQDVVKLGAQSVKNDQQVSEALGISLNDVNLEEIGYYNAQDYVFQRPTWQPARLEPRRILDFGAGHGRQANLLRDQLIANEVHYCAVDVTPACYLTQSLYMQALQVPASDYLEDPNVQSADDLNHLPGWRLDLISDDSKDMVIAVQVLRELSKGALASALRHFARILKPGGALYIRDHIGFHNPNAVNLEQVLEAYGFVLEWHPQWTDRQDVHGIPRLWRKMSEGALLGSM